MTTDEWIEWRCKKCGDIFETKPSRHDPDTCECGEAFVDHEKHYVRSTFTTVEIIDSASS